MNRIQKKGEKYTDVKVLSSGLIADMDYELLPSMKKNFYISCENMRPNSSSGGYGALVRIDGESKVFDLSGSVAGNYRCIASFLVNEKFVTIWGGFGWSLPCLVMVGSLIVLSSLKLPYNANTELQYDFDPDKDTELLVLTDNEIPPVFLSIIDMEKNIGNNKYFSDFDYVDYSVSTSSINNRPVVTGLKDVGLGSGQPVGKYMYHIRYITKSGDRSGISAPSQFIDIPSYSKINNSHIRLETDVYGSDSNVSVRTRYAPEITFRIHNVNKPYSYIEIVRADYNNGSGIGFTPSFKVISKIDISSIDISVMTFIDTSSPGDHETISEADINLEINRILSAKSVRYFSGRVSLFNVKYESAVADQDVSFILDQNNDVYAYPIMKNIGVNGLLDPMNSSYYKPHMHGERYSYVAVFFDENMGRSLSVPMQGMSDYQFPNRRDKMSADSKAESDSVVCASVDGQIVDTFEIFDMRNATQRGSSGDQTSINISCNGSKTTDGINYDAGTIGFQPRKPFALGSTDNNDNKRNVTEVWTDSSNKISYDPFGYKQEYLSLGLSIKGLSSYPKWAKSFSIYRSERAGRVVCQGISFYSLNPATASGLDIQNSNSNKDLDEIWFQSSDILNGVVSPDVVSALLAGGSGYKIQLVSPVGFFMDIYDTERNDAVLSLACDKDVDMTLSAKIIAEYNNKRCNVGEPTSNVGKLFNNDGYVAYGKWRNTDQDVANDGFVFDGLSGGNNEFSILSFTEVVDGEGVSYFKIKLDKPIYRHQYPTASGNSYGVEFSEAGARDWHEPVYIANIIEPGATSDSQNEKFYNIGHFQKLESIIGVSSGLPNQSFEIVDEREVDFYATDGSKDRYIYVSNGIDEKIFIDITNKNSSDVSVINDDILNSTNNYNGVYISGTYTYSNKNVLFGFQIPDYGYNIIVRYNNLEPIHIFGGDVAVGEDYHLFVNREGNNINPIDTDQLFLNNPLPYRTFSLSEPILVLIKGNGAINKIQDNNKKLTLGFIRQVLLSFVAESFTFIPYKYGAEYPKVNYIQRPHRYDSNLPDNYCSNGGNVWDDYKDTYPVEDLRWLYGGFRPYTYPVNFDYSKIARHEVSVKKPNVGFTDKRHFRTRIHSSLPKVYGNPDSQSLRTFPILNTYDLPDNNGEIIRSWSTLSKSGENLYAFLEKDIAILLTEKRILREINGSELASIGSDSGSFILKHLFLNKRAGISNRMHGAFGDSGDLLMFANDRSVFIFDGNEVTDICVGRYRSVIHKDFISRVMSSSFNRLDVSYDEFNNDFYLSISYPIDGDGVSSIDNFEKFRDADNLPALLNKSDFGNGMMIYSAKNFKSTINLEVIDAVPGNKIVIGNYNIEGGIVLLVSGSGTVQNSITISFGSTIEITVDSQTGVVSSTIASPTYNYSKLPIVRKTFIFNSDKNIFNWIGNFDFIFDKFISKEFSFFGVKNLSLFELNKGDVIDNSNIKSSVIVPFAPERIFDKELRSVFVNSNSSPSSIEILDDSLTVIKTINGSDIDNFYDVYSQFAGRGSSDLKRFQGTHFLVKINFDGSKKNILRSVGIQYKLL